jgi:hypothetical protein
MMEVSVQTEDGRMDRTNNLPMRVSFIVHGYADADVEANGSECALIPQTQAEDDRMEERNPPTQMTLQLLTA